jgi:hypothetical protein
MVGSKRGLGLAFITVLLFTLLSVSALSQNVRSAGPYGVLWRDPGNISARDLRYGPGSAALAPTPPFRYTEEDKDGVSPKFKIRDANNVEWSVKLGIESQAETVVTRMMWAMGYFAEEAYYYDRAEIMGLPRLSRGRQFVENQRFVRGARFEPRRANVQRGPTWKWLKNPFVGTRELNGLKTLMVLMANYDTSTANNRILKVTDPSNGRIEDQYVVTDVGATLGRIGGMGGKRTKNNLGDYRSNGFIKSVKNGYVEFDYRTRPKNLGYFTFIFSPGYWRSQSDKEKAMKRIPVEHARWIGNMLSRLTDEQLRDAFRAANYDAATMEGFVSTIRGRIDQLNRLSVTAAQPRRSRTNAANQPARSRPRMTNDTANAAIKRKKLPR